MFARNSAPELTAAHCQIMETLRAGIEIFTGERVKYEHISFRRSRASIAIAGQSKLVRFQCIGASLDWCFDQGHEAPNEWLSVLHEEDGNLRVFNWLSSGMKVLVRGQYIDCYWFGQDHTNREVKFLYFEHAAQVAREAGISMAELQAEVTSLVVRTQVMPW